MRKLVREFIRRGMVAFGVGPVVLAMLYLIVGSQTGVEVLTVSQVCRGIFSLSVLAFLAGGMNAIYQVERLRLMLAILIHGGVLYAGYLVIYLVNGWLEWGIMPILVFSAIFILGYLVIWGVVYSIIRYKTARINLMLKKKQQATEL